jgi:hypothetical protein
MFFMLIWPGTVVFGNNFKKKWCKESVSAENIVSSGISIRFSIVIRPGTEGAEIGQP